MPRRASAGRPAPRIYRQSSYRSRERPIWRDLIWGISTEICGLEMTERQRANHGSVLGAARGRGVRGSENGWAPPSLPPSFLVQPPSPPASASAALSPTIQSTCGFVQIWGQTLRPYVGRGFPSQGQTPSPAAQCEERSPVFNPCLAPNRKRRQHKRNM